MPEFKQNLPFADADGCYELLDGNRIPAIGFGTWRVKDREDGAAVCAEAIRAGYRHFDTAYLYGSEESVGDAIRASGIDRSEFFVTTKVWKDDLSAEGARLELETSLSRLGMDYVDLLLIHWPRRDSEDPEWRERLTETWNAFQQFKREGLVKSIGVANFLPHHLVPLLARARIRPSVNQLEIHPGHTQFPTVNWCLKQGIQVQAWSPLGRGALLTNPTVLAIARAHNVAPAQVLLRWSIERQLCPIVKAVDLIHMRENLRLYHFELSDEEISALDKLPPSTAYSGLHPDTVTF